MSQPAITGVIFDKDGTLIDFHATWSVFAAHCIDEFAGQDARARRALADVWEFDLATSRFADTSPVIAASNREVAEMAAAVLSHLDVDDLEQRMAISAEAAPVQAILPLGPVLGALRAQGMRLGVMTNDVEAAARAHMAQLGVVDRFDAIFGSDSGYGAKPSGAPLIACAAAMGVATNATAMVGDSTHDLIAGRAAGMHTVGVLTGTVSQDVLAPHADVVLASIEQLPAYLATL